MTAYEKVRERLLRSRETWAITGVAGSLVRTCWKLCSRSTSASSASTISRPAIDAISRKSKRLVSPAQWARFRFIEGDICAPEDCLQVCEGVDYVLHQAALASVPRSVADPIATNAVNVTGFLNMLVAARDAKAARFVYAASSSTYGDHPGLPKVEDTIGKPLSPYAVTKYVNELYAEVFARCYDLNYDRVALLQCLWPPPGPRGRICRGDPEMDGRDDQGRRRLHQWRWRDQP